MTTNDDNGPLRRLVLFEDLVGLREKLAAALCPSATVDETATHAELLQRAMSNMRLHLQDALQVCDNLMTDNGRSTEAGRMTADDHHQ